MWLLENLFACADHPESMKNVYLAAPLFLEAERDFNSKLRGELEGLGISVFLPQEHSNDTNAQARNEAIFSKNLVAI